MGRWDYLMGDGKTHAKEYTKEHMSVPYNINILIHTRTLYSMAGYGHAVFLDGVFWQPGIQIAVYFFLTLC